MDEMIETVNQNAEQARAQSRAQQLHDEEVAERQYQEWLAEQARKRQRVRRRATKRTILRSVASLVLAFGLWLAMGFDLIAFELAVALLAVDLAWMAFRVGAWAQFMFAGEELFKWN